MVTSLSRQEFKRGAAPQDIALSERERVFVQAKWAAFPHPVVFQDWTDVLHQKYPPRAGRRRLPMVASLLGEQCRGFRQQRPLSLPTLRRGNLKVRTQTWTIRILLSIVAFGAALSDVFAQADAPPANLPTVNPPTVAAPADATANATTLFLSKGTPVKVELIEDVRSNHARQGDVVHFRIAADVRSPDGKLLLSEGLSALGKVTDVRRAGWFGSPGRVSVACERIYPVGSAGAYPPVAVATKDREDIGNTARDNTPVAAATACVLGFVVGGIVDFTQNFSLNLNFSIGGATQSASNSSSPNHGPAILAGVGTTVLIGALWHGREATLKQGTASVVYIAEDALLSPLPAATSPTHE